MKTLKVSSSSHCLSASCTTGLPLVWRGIFVMGKEIWRDVPNFEGLYMVSNHGNVICVKRTVNGSIQGKSVIRKQKKLLMTKTNNGYYKYTLFKNPIRKTFSAHRLVAIAFIPNHLNSPCVNHIDGDKLNNRVDNLEWCTYSENILHAYRLGLSRQDGEFHATKKLNWDKVKEIRRLHKIGCDKYKLGEMFNVHPGHINNIIANLYWKE